MISGQQTQSLQAAMNNLYYRFKLARGNEDLTDDDASKITVAFMEATELIEKLIDKRASKAKELWDDRGDDSGKYELEKGGK